MKKIKNFKINIRQREVLRNLKTRSGISEITPQLEDAVRRECQRMQGVLMPSAIYETIPKGNKESPAAAVFADNSAAVSLFLITIGGNIDSEINEAGQRGEALLSNILSAIAVEALEQSVNFVYKLIQEEAKQENCEITASVMADSSVSRNKVFDVLAGEKIGVRACEDGRISPDYSTYGHTCWIPVKKRGAKSAAANS